MKIIHDALMCILCVRVYRYLILLRVFIKYCCSFTKSFLLNCLQIVYIRGEIDVLIYQNLNFMTLQLR